MAFTTNELITVKTKKGDSGYNNIYLKDRNSGTYAKAGSAADIETLCGIIESNTDTVVYGYDSPVGKAEDVTKKKTSVSDTVGDSVKGSFKVYNGTRKVATISFPQIIDTGVADSAKAIRDGLLALDWYESVDGVSSKIETANLKISYEVI